MIPGIFTISSTSVSFVISIFTPSWVDCNPHVLPGNADYPGIPRKEWNLRLIETEFGLRQAHKNILFLRIML